MCIRDRFIGLKFPLSIDDISKLEKMNDNKFVCNVFGYTDEEGLFVLRSVSSIIVTGAPVVINLLLLSNSHYCLIRDFNMFMNSKNETNGFKYCQNCLTGYERPVSLEKHIKICKFFEAGRVDIPKPGEVVKFKNYDRQIKHPFVLYSDFESFQPKPNPCVQSSTTKTNKKHKSQCLLTENVVTESKHVPSGHGIYCTYTKNIMTTLKL